MSTAEGEERKVANLSLIRLGKAMCNILEKKSCAFHRNQISRNINSNIRALARSE